MSDFFYQFNFSYVSPKSPPTSPCIEIIKKANTNKKLLNYEVDILMNLMYGDGRNLTSYKYQGWVWDITKAKQIKPFIVNFRNGNTETLYSTNIKNLKRILLLERKHFHWIKPC
jgi:hypothetical protein